MKRYVSVLAGVVLNVLGGSAHAIALSECITLDSRGSGGVEMRNNCNKTMNVTYCVDNSRSSFACVKGTGFGGKTLAPGNKEVIPFYSSDGGGRVYWAACPYPDVVADWSGRGDRYDCR